MHYVYTDSPPNELKAFLLQVGEDKGNVDIPKLFKSKNPILPRESPGPQDISSKPRPGRDSHIEKHVIKIKRENLVLSESDVQRKKYIDAILRKTSDFDKEFLCLLVITPANFFIVTVNI